MTDSPVSSLGRVPGRAPEPSRADGAASAQPSLLPAPAGLDLRRALLERYVRSTVHRLNNDLAVITGFADLIRSNESDPHRPQQLDEIMAKSRDATRLLQLYSVLADPGVAETGVIELGTVVQMARELLTPTVVHEVSAALDIRVARSLRPVRGNRTRLLQWVATLAAACLPREWRAGDGAGVRLRLSSYEGRAAVRLRFTCTRPAGASPAETGARVAAIERALAETAAISNETGAVLRSRWRGEAVVSVCLDFEGVGRIEAPEAAATRSAPVRICVCMAEEMLAELVQSVLEEAGYSIELAEDTQAAGTVMQREDCRALILESSFGGEAEQVAAHAAALGIARVGWVRNPPLDRLAPDELVLSKPFRPADLLAFAERLLSE